MLTFTASVNFFWFLKCNPLALNLVGFRFDSKESACKAIVEVNGSEVGGFIVKCSWGKESNETNSGSIPNYTPQVTILPF